jgi:hypothetical protein
MGGAIWSVTDHLDIDLGVNVRHVRLSAPEADAAVAGVAFASRRARASRAAGGRTFPDDRRLRAIALRARAPQARAGT